MFILLAIVLVLFSVFYLFRRRKLSLFEKHGIKGPTPNILFGNLNEFKNKVSYELLLKWEQEYGKVYGYYEGTTPNLVIGDPDLIQEVFVKQFSNFHGRKLFPLQSNPDKDEKVSMFIARGKRWKRLRNTINPAFSESKMRRMFPLIDESIDSFIKKVGQQIADGPMEINVQELLQRLTMDIICKCAFGVDTNCQVNVNDPFIVSLRKFLGGFTFSNFKAVVALVLSDFKPILIKILELTNKRPSQNEDLKKIRQTLIEVIEARKKSSVKRFDLLQLLLDAETPDVKILDEDNMCPINDHSGKLEGHSEEEKTEQETVEPKRLTNQKDSKLLTTEEVISQANLFLFAGYETSSTALSFIVHTFATNPLIQEKLQFEIDNVFQNIDQTDVGSLELYDSIAKLPYLNAVIYEVLRFYPFASIVVNRACLKSGGTYLSNGTHIPEGVNIIPNVYSIHFDKDIWNTVDPNIFAPERFLQSSDDKELEFIGPPHQFAWLPFGAGPRNCIGQRFAIMVIKATLMRFVHNYQVKVSKNTENPLTLRVGATITPKNGVHIEISQRNH